MKSYTSLAFVASLISLLPTAEASIGSSWSVTNVPSTGLKDITFPLTIVETDHISGYYFVQQFNFVNASDVGYTGLQPCPDRDGKPVLHGVFSSFIKGSTTNDLNCHGGADGSSAGVSCSFEWNGVYNRTYGLEVKYNGNQLWNGTAVDTVTGERIHIGSYTLPAGVGGIKRSQLGFVEWYPWNSGRPQNCTLLPYQKTIFGHPNTTNVGSVGTQSLFVQKGGCVGKIPFHSEEVA